MKNLIEAEAGYQRMDQSRLASLVGEFEIDYAVFEQPFRWAATASRGRFYQ